MVEAALIETGEAVWRRERAGRVAVLVDCAAYFVAVLEALQNARHSITLLGWGFDPRARLRPDRTGGDHGADEIGKVLTRLSAERPELNIRILVWKSALPIAASQHFFPHRARSYFAGTRIQFELDALVPLGACHHQKVLVIDDALAFCGGGDISIDRWDSTAHLDHDPRRIMPGGVEHPPRHEVMTMIDGAAASALGDLARERWRRATGEVLEPCPTGEDPWPPFITPNFTDIDVGVARTQPAWRDEPEVREIETLHLQSITRAERCIYLENQYFTSPLICEALKARLAEPDGPEVVVVSTEHSPSWFDQLTMDRTRWTMVEMLKANDPFGRFRAYCPHTAQGRTIIVHAKVSIVDNERLRVGSANLNNRSAGFDTECDLVLEAKDEAAQAEVRAFRCLLLAHHLGCAAAVLEQAIADNGGSLVKALDALDTLQPRRLAPLPQIHMGPITRFIAAFHIGDPLGPASAWKPFTRKAVLNRRIAALKPGQKV